MGSTDKPPPGDGGGLGPGRVYLQAFTACQAEPKPWAEKV